MNHYYEFFPPFVMKKSFKINAVLKRICSIRKKAFDSLSEIPIHGPLGGLWFQCVHKERSNKPVAEANK